VTPLVDLHWREADDHERRGGRTTHRLHPTPSHTTLWDATFFERNHLQEPHYYIRWVGVATSFQGQGLGTALLRPTLDRCDREGLPAYLQASTERSAALYERLGFVHLGELQVPDGPRFWPMRRPPIAA
jgi:RimJ/RimL family protein N-acetyltransferase